MFVTASLLPLSLFVEVVVSVVTLSGGASRLHLPSIVDSEQKCTNVFVRPLGHFLQRRKKVVQMSWNNEKYYNFNIPLCCTRHTLLTIPKTGRKGEVPFERQLQAGIIVVLMNIFLLILLSS